MFDVLQPEDELQRRLTAFRDRLFNIAASSIERATAPLVHIKHDQVVEIRSSVLVQIAQMKFLVTAAHEMVDHLKAGRPPFVLMSKGKIHPIALHNEQFWTTNDENVDLAVTQLHESTVAYLNDEYSFLRLTDMMSKNDRKHESAFYALAGFPSARYTPDTNGIQCAHNWKYLTYRFNGDYSQVERYNPNVHLILAYERDTRASDDTIVHPPGLSGCGVWHVGDPFSARLFTADDFKLVGIQTAWNRKVEYAKCTWIDSVLTIIWRYFPDARPPMRLHGMSF